MRAEVLGHSVGLSRGFGMTQVFSPAMPKYLRNLYAEWDKVCGLGSPSPLGKKPVDIPRPTPKISTRRPDRYIPHHWRARCRPSCPRP